MNRQTRIILIAIAALLLAIGAGCSSGAIDAAAQQEKNSQPVLINHNKIATVVDANKLKITLDTAKWKLGYQNKKEAADIFEFVHTDQAVENWTELVTAQTFTGLKDRYTVQQYAERFYNAVYMSSSNAMKKAEKQITDSNIGSSYISNEPNNVIVYWFVKDVPTEDDQMEIARIFSNDNSRDIYVVHFAIKNKKYADLGEDELNTIMEILRSAVIK